MAIDWIFFFNLVGISSIVWAVGWGVFSTDMAISQRAALESLDSDIQIPRRRKLSVIPVIKSHQFWITSMGQVMMSALVILLTSSIPKFLYQVYSVPNGDLPAIAFISFTTFATLSSLFYGKVKDRLGNELRQLLGYIALFPSGMLLFGIAYVSCDLQTISALMIIASGFVGLSISVFVPSFLDLSPTYAGQMHGLTNIFTGVAGFIIPYGVGLLVEANPGLESSWSPIWLVAGIVSAIYSILFLLFFRSRELELDEEGDDEETRRLLQDRNLNYQDAIDDSDQ